MGSTTVSGLRTVRIQSLPLEASPAHLSLLNAYVYIIVCCMSIQMLVPYYTSITQTGFPAAMREPSGFWEMGCQQSRVEARSPKSKASILQLHICNVRVVAKLHFCHPARLKRCGPVGDFGFNLGLFSILVLAFKASEPGLSLQDSWLRITAQHLRFVSCGCIAVKTSADGSGATWDFGVACRLQERLYC